MLDTDPTLSCVRLRSAAACGKLHTQCRLAPLSWPWNVGTRGPQAFLLVGHFSRFIRTRYLCGEGLRFLRKFQTHRYFFFPSQSLMFHLI